MNRPISRMLNEYHIEKEFGIIMQKYYLGVKDAVFDRGAVIGTLYFGGPNFENHKIFCLILKEAHCCSRCKQKFGDCRNMGLQNIGCQ